MAISGVLTRRGWAVAIGGVILALAGRLLGLLELYVLAAGCWAMLGLAIVFLVSHRVDVGARRTMFPPRIQAGDETRVELTVSNQGRRRTPVVDLRDPVDGGPRRARLMMAPLAGGAEVRAHYRIPTERRGVIQVGPLEAHRFDPMALATKGALVASVSELVVYPAVEQLLPMAHGPGDDRRGRSRQASALGSSGDDFYALRPWVIGDDLRRVHWPSTARRDELMMRQHDVPWQGRATVVLDVRARHHDAESLEQAVSAAASIAAASGRGGSLFRLLTTDGGDSGFGNGAAHLDGILDLLARITATPRDLPELPETSGAIALIVTADVPAADRSRMVRGSGHHQSPTLVVIGRDGAELPAGTGAVVPVAAGEPLAPAWNRAMTSRHGRTLATGGVG